MIWKFWVFHILVYQRVLSLDFSFFFEYQTCVWSMIRNATIDRPVFLKGSVRHCFRWQHTTLAGFKDSFFECLNPWHHETSFASTYAGCWTCFALGHWVIWVTWCFSTLFSQCFQRFPPRLAGPANVGGLFSAVRYRWCHPKGMCEICSSVAPPSLREISSADHFDEYFLNDHGTNVISIHLKYPGEE